ncbi:MAG: Lrp/AsnC family transcriptional regulator [Candidatus Micrarchaeota archaeon]
MARKTEHTKHAMDAVDLEIIRELKLDSRRSFRELSSVICLSPAALIERVKKLEDAEIILGYSARVDHYVMGYDFMGLVQISIAKGALLEVQEKISKLRGVAAVYDLTGEYDSVALVLCKSRVEMSNLIKSINKIPEVSKTNTSMILNVVKRMDEFQI